MIILIKQELTRHGHLETSCLSTAAIDPLSCSFFAIIFYKTSYTVISLFEFKEKTSSFIRM